MLFRKFKRKPQIIRAFEITEALIEQNLNASINLLPNYIKIEISDVIKLLSIKLVTDSQVANLSFGDWICENSDGSVFFVRRNTFSKSWEEYFD